jgi:tight adherence protein C
VTPELRLTILAVFGAVAAIAGAITWFFLEQATPERRRFKALSQLGTVSGLLLENQTLTPDDGPFVKRMSAIVPRSPASTNRLRRRFMRAGCHTLTPIAVYTAAQIVLPVMFGLLAVVLFGVGNWPVIACFALVGWLLPGFVLSRRIKARQRVIQNGLPDALDLMIVCLEAGCAMDQAILKVGEELAAAYPALSEEFKLLITETRAGKPRIEAFKNLAVRTGVEDVRGLVAMLVQTDRFGTSVAQALRTHAEVSRTRRRQRAEERAAKIGVKLVFPLVFLLFPAFFVVTLGPPVIQFVRILLGQVIGR